MRDVAGEPAVLAYLTSRSADLDEPIDRAFGRLHLANQADIRLFLMDSARNVVFAFYPGTEADPLPLESMVPGGFGPFFEHGKGVYFWTAVPVLAGVDTLGLIADLRRVGGTG